MRRFRMGVVGAVAAGAMFVGAAAEAVTYRTDVVEATTGDIGVTYHGFIANKDNTDCLPNRAMTAYQKNKKTGKKYILGTGTTDTNGNYSFAGTQQPLKSTKLTYPTMKVSQSKLSKNQICGSGKTDIAFV